MAKLNKIRRDFRLRQSALDDLEFMANALNISKTDMVEQALIKGLHWYAKKNGYELPSDEKLKKRIYLKKEKDVRFVEHIDGTAEKKMAEEEMKRTTEIAKTRWVTP